MPLIAASPAWNQLPSLLDSTGHSTPQLSTAPTTRLHATLTGAITPRPTRDSCREAEGRQQTHNDPQHKTHSSIKLPAASSECEYYWIQRRVVTSANWPRAPTIRVRPAAAYCCPLRLLHCSRVRPKDRPTGSRWTDNRPVHTQAQSVSTALLTWKSKFQLYLSACRPKVGNRTKPLHAGLLNTHCTQKQQAAALSTKASGYHLQRAQNAQPHMLIGVRWQQPLP